MNPSAIGLCHMCEAIDAFKYTTGMINTTLNLYLTLSSVSSVVDLSVLLPEECLGWEDALGADELGVAEEGMGMGAGYEASI